MLFSKIVEDAGNVAMVGSYFNENQKIFNEYLESLTSVREINHLIEVLGGIEFGLENKYKGEFPELYKRAKVHKDFLSSFSNEDLKSGILCAGEPIPMIQTCQEITIGRKVIDTYLPSSGASVFLDEVIPLEMVKWDCKVSL